VRVTGKVQPGIDVPVTLGTVINPTGVRDRFAVAPDPPGVVTKFEDVTL
jgi:hypothetical protein